MGLSVGEGFDVAILDVHMPELDGLSLARQRPALPAGADVPRVVLLARAARAGGCRRRFADNSGKPLKPSDLLDTLMTICASGNRSTSWSGAPRLGAEPPEMSAEQPLRILLAEDNAVEPEGRAAPACRQLGYRADWANGYEVLAASTRQGYDVVSMDIQMPEMDGLDATRAIRAQVDLSQPRIVAMTVLNALAGDRERCIAAARTTTTSANRIRLEELTRAPPGARRSARRDCAG